MSKKTSPYNLGFSSRIKKIFIELHGYNFFHGPSELKNIDKRFIGRRDIINKLKSIILNSETRSGAYLVTGYRGMGKSSFVSKTIDEIDPTNRRSTIVSRHIRILVLLLFLSLFNISSTLNQILLLVVPLFLAALFGWHLMRNDGNTNNLKLNETRPSKKRRGSFLKRLANLFFIPANTNPATIYLRLSQTLFIVSLIFFLANLVEWQAPGLASNPAKYLILLAVLVLFNISATIIADIKAPSIDKRKSVKDLIGNFFKEFIKRPKHSIRNYFNYGKRIYIRINLGYDDLREIDILRLISRSILNEYKKFRKSHIRNLPSTLTKFVLLYFLVGLVFYYTPIYTLNQELKNQSSFSEFFPSQDPTKAFFYSLSDKIEMVKCQLNAFNHTFDRLIQFFGALEKTRIGNQFYVGITLKLNNLALPYNPIPYFTFTCKMPYNNIKKRIENMLHSLEQTRETLKLILPENFPKIVHEGNKLKSACNYIDHFIAINYSRLVLFFQQIKFIKNPQLNKFLSSESISHKFLLFPTRLDYLFLLYFLLAYLLAKYLLIPYVSSYSPSALLRKIKQLNEMIDYQITNEQGGNIEVEQFGKLSFSGRKIKSRGQATIRDIEKNLIEILEGFDRHSIFSPKPEFVFIFDELDKIEPHENISISLRQSEKPKISDQPETTYFATDGVRKRQHTIFKILSNLKHFLNTAKAKFIFIAGRELYDAALADVSDRNFFIGSIFHDVIYVNSFMTDLSDNKASEITSMTEQYICQFLFPPHHQPQEYSLKEYKKFLEDFYGTTNQNSSNGENSECQQIEKIIFTLSNFVTYLAYRSNGAPKRITNYLENYIYKPTNKEELTSANNLCIGYNHSNLYLKFGFYDQYTFGMLSYLAKPVILAVSDSIKDYGDKLMISTAFLTDHLYKFHRNGFSWRNIELTPEIVDINKAPQLREFIALIISHLSNTHLVTIIKGLHTYKFRKKISEEIDFLSKIQEGEAAAFNFTLDESLSLKRHHRIVLNDLKESHNQGQPYKSNEEYINSIALTHMIIGDLHFYDDEYNDAIVEYMEATEALRKINFTSGNEPYLMVYIRSMLKLGFALEKRKSYSDAYMIYRQLVAKIIKFRNIELKDYQKGNRQFSTSIFEGQRIIFQPLLAKLHMIEKANLGGITLSDLNQIENEFNSLTQRTNNGEKFMIEAEFWAKVGDILYFKNGIHLPFIDRCKDKEKPKYYCQGEDAICGKNQDIKTNFEETKYLPPCRSCEYYMKSLKKICENFLAIGFDSGENQSVIAKLFYKSINKHHLSQNSQGFHVLANVLSNIGNNFLSCCSKGTFPNTNFLEEFLDFLENESRNYRSFFINKKDAPPYKNTENKTKLSNNSERNRSNTMIAKEDLDAVTSTPKTFNKIEEVFIYYYLSYRFYTQSGQPKEASIQILKIFCVIRNLLRQDNSANDSKRFNETVQKQIGKLKSTLFKRGIEKLYRAYGNIHRIEIEIYKNIFNDKTHPDDPANLQNISISGDFREFLFVVKEIELICSNNALLDHIKTCPVTPNSTVNRMYNRILELKYKTMLNNKIHNRIINSQGGSNADKKNPDSQIIDKLTNLSKNTAFSNRKNAAVEFLIIDSISCLLEILKILQISSVTYMMNYSILAMAHEYLGDWCVLYWKHIKEFPKNLERIAEELKNQTGEDNFSSLAPKYHYERAMAANYSILELHGEGKAYREMVERVFYLNDDFNDTIYHFFAAADRYRISTGKIGRKLECLVEKTKASWVFEYKNYEKSLDNGKQKDK
jgi:hypothetical protein